MMTDEARQFLLTTAWIFRRHGQNARARAVVEALVDANPRDGVAAVALAELMLEEGESANAIQALHSADVPKDLAHAAAVLETRALRLARRDREAAEHWRRHIESQKGSERKWTA